jgi:hypothetical protein
MSHRCGQRYRDSFLLPGRHGTVGRALSALLLTSAGKRPITIEQLPNDAATGSLARGYHTNPSLKKPPRFDGKLSRTTTFRGGPANFCHSLSGVIADPFPPAADRASRRFIPTNPDRSRVVT